MANVEERINKEGKKSYRVKVRVKGYPVQTATFALKTKAKEWAVKTELAIKEGKYFSEVQAKKHTVGFIIDKYVKEILPSKTKVKKDWEGQLKWWKDKIGYYKLSDITPSVIVQLRQDLINEKRANNGKFSDTTVNRYITTIQCVFSIAVNEWELLEVNPFFKVKKLKEPRGRVRYLTEQEKDLLLEECKRANNPYLYPVVLLAISTGARKMEILTLKWKNILFDDGLIILYETKNNETRSVPLVGKAKEVLKQLYEDRESDIWVFPSQDGSKPFDVTRSWNKALKNTNIEDFRFHDLRHTAASYLAMSGSSLTVVGHILGHKTPQMTKKYSHLTNDYAKEAVENMSKKFI